MSRNKAESLDESDDMYNQVQSRIPMTTLYQYALHLHSFED